MSERNRYSLVVATNPARDKLVVEMAVGEDIVFEFFIEGGKRHLAIYVEHGKPPIETDADVFFEALQDAYADVKTLPGNNP